MNDRMRQTGLPDHFFAFDLTKIGSFESKNVKAAVSSDNHTHTHVRSGGRCGTGDVIGPCRRRGGGVFSALYVCPANQIGRFKAMYVPIAPIAYIENGSPGRSTIWFRLGVSEGMVLSSAEDLVRLLHAAALRARRRNCGHCESAHEHLRSGVRHIRHQWSLHSTPHHPHMRI